MSTTTEKWTIFGERLKTELERQEMSLRQFAEKAGLTLTTACRYVHSQRTPRATEILKAAKVLGVTCDYMLGLSDDPHKTRDGWAKAGFHELPSAQPETHEERTETHGVCLDVIDRQATLDWLKNEWNGMITSLFDGIKALPSAQPDSKETSPTHKALDTVSRQAVIEINRSYHGQMPNEVNHRIWKEINELPSAQPEIIRCKDCKYNSNTCGNYVNCDIIPQMFGRTVDNFCSMAERRTDE